MPYSPNYRPLTNKQKRDIRRRDRHTCTRCDRPGSQVDHVIPEAEGGTDHPDNLTTLCEDCHRRKSCTEAAAGRRRRAARRRLPKRDHPGLA